MWPIPSANLPTQPVLRSLVRPKFVVVFEGCSRAAVHSGASDEAGIRSLHGGVSLDLFTPGLLVNRFKTLIRNSFPEERYSTFRIQDCSAKATENQLIATIESAYASEGDRHRALHRCFRTAGTSGRLRGGEPLPLCGRSRLLQHRRMLAQKLFLGAASDSRQRSGAPQIGRSTALVPTVSKPPIRCFEGEQPSCGLIRRSARKNSTQPGFKCQVPVGTILSATSPW